jgi:hypothetical protein
MYRTRRARSSTPRELRARVRPFGNIPGPSVHISEVIAAIEAAVPEARIDYEDIALPFPEQLAIGELAAPVTPLAEGVRQTIELFRARAL